MKKNNTYRKLHNKYLLLLTGFVVSWVFLSFQISWKPIGRIDIEAKSMQTDRMGNIYAISHTNQLYKYDPLGKLLGTLNYAYLGNISQIDAGNPLEIYLFYKELNALVFLDNNLAYRGRLQLSDVGIIQASAAARSYSNGIWVFDQGDLQLKKLNKDGSLVQASGNIRQFAKSNNIQPNLIIDNGSRVFVNDSTEGILVFDVFANYIKTIPITGKQEVKIRNKELYYAASDRLISYDMATLQRDTLKMPMDTFSGFSIEKERLYLMNRQGIQIFDFNKH